MYAGITTEATDIAADLHALEAKLSAAVEELHSAEARVRELGARPRLDADSVRNWLYELYPDTAVDIVPEHVQERIVELTLENGGIDPDDAIEALGAEALIAQLSRRGELPDVSDYPSRLDDIETRVRDLLTTDLEDVPAEVENIARDLAYLSADLSA